jgi:hypothetical protein
MARSEEWNIPDEIARLSKEAPSLAAFPGVGGVVWVDSDNYSFTAEGAKKHDNLFLILTGDLSRDGGAARRRIPLPSEDGADLKVTEAGWYDPSTGLRLGDLPRREYDESGLRGVEIDFPEEASGCVVAISTTTLAGGEYNLEGVKMLAGEYPVWEQTITVDIPQGMNLYWEGAGIRAPERSSSGGTERVRWTLLNQPVWRSYGILEEGRPALVFSLQHGQISRLKALKELEGAPYAPAIPPGISSVRSSLTRVAQALTNYMSPRLIDAIEGADSGSYRVRPTGDISPDGPWTDCEQVMIAAKWASALGFDARVYWTQKIPVGIDGPASASLWRGPVLKVVDGSGGEFYFKSGRASDLEKLHPSLYGETLFRAGNSGAAERIEIPRGSASDHLLSQKWKLAMDENGIATGSMELTATGAWVSVMGLESIDLSRGDASRDDIDASLRENMDFDIPGLVLVAKSMKNSSTALRVVFDVKASSGIVSGNDILFRMTGGIPRCFEDIAAADSKYSFRFPFLFEMNSVISTPKGYRAVSLPGKVQSGDSKIMLEESLVHWTKKARAESACRWTVRSVNIDEYLLGRVQEQLAGIAGWSRLEIPFRK